MPSGPLTVIVLIAAAVSALLALGCGDESEGGLRNAEKTPQELGYYPPAPSTAVGMTPEWREFAFQVDRICGESYNDAVATEAQVDQIAEVRGWSDGQAEEAGLAVWNHQARTILRSTEALGAPPERPDLFSRWRSNVARRAALRNQAAEAAGQGRWGAYRDFMNRIYPLKDRSDEIGQSFGLRICTSN
jgi:hypothetical protein